MRRVIGAVLRLGTLVASLTAALSCSNHSGTPPSGKSLAAAAARCVQRSSTSATADFPLDPPGAPTAVGALQGWLKTDQSIPSSGYLAYATPDGEAVDFAHRSGGDVDVVVFAVRVTRGWVVTGWRGCPTIP